MSQKIIQDQPTQQTLDIFSYTQETIHLFNQIMSPEYSKNIIAEVLEDDLVKFFNGLIWAQKKNPLLVYQMFEMKSCHQIVQKYISINPIVLLRNSILLLGNCEVGGLVAEQLVQHRYPHCLLTHILQPDLLAHYHQQIGEYIGNFFKCYNKLIQISWLPKFVLEQQYFQLLELNLKYYNCPDLMARTNALNIVLDLLKHKQVRQFIANCQQRQGFYSVIFERMCKLFRNQLVEFGLRIAHISQQDNVDYIFSELEDKISLWFDISTNFQGIQHKMELPFCNQVLVPLVIGPLQVKQMPLFTLKYSLFVIKKLMPIMRNLNLLQIYVRIIFVEDKVFYYPNSLRKAFIQPFSLQKLLAKDISKDQPDEKSGNYKIKDFYSNLFTSKDNHFILMINTLFVTLFKEAQPCPQLCKQYGFHYNGQLSNKVCRILLTQLKDIHQLHTVQSILDTLISINNGKSLDAQLQYEYITIFQHLIYQLKSGLNMSKSSNANENIRSLGESVEYDLASTHQIVFKKDNDHGKYQNIYKVVFEWEIKKEEMSSREFYARVPDSPAQYLRYLFIKFMYLKKARIILLDIQVQTNQYEHYYQLMLTHCPYIPEDMYNPTQIPQLFEICELQPQKQKTPTSAYFIKNSNFFILGLPKNHRILITHGIKIKHVSIQQAKKKKMKITIRAFSPELMQLVETETLWMKYDAKIMEHIINKSEAVIKKNVDFVRSCLEKAEQQQSVPSLI